MNCTLHGALYGTCDITNKTERVGWVSDPNTGRGTASLLYSCFFTIFLCVWSSYHPHIPGTADGPLKCYIYKLKWVGIGILAPEWLAFNAIKEMIAARELTKQMRSFEHFYWTNVHSQFLLMGGFVIAKAPESKTIDDAHSFHEFLRFEKPVTRSRLIPTRGDLKDRSKADGLTKTIAVFQTTWMITQVIGRAISHLPISALEIATLGYAACSLATYFAWWDKPYDAQSRIYYRLRDSSNTNEPSYELSSVAALGDQLLQRRAWDHVNPQNYKSAYLGFLITLVFGAIHCVAWDFEFPTVAERLAWRIATAGSIGFSMSFMILILLGPESAKMGDITAVMVVLLSLLYLASRALLVSLVLSELRALPVGVYQTVRWTNFIPAIR
jgi:hypothetical protein